MIRLQGQFGFFLLSAACAVSSVSAQAPRTSRASEAATARATTRTAMFPRLWDRRVGPFYKVQAGYLVRQRLQRQNPSEPSDVVRPIVYTIDSTVPRQWIPWVRRGIEAWDSAFAQIGFRHAIVIHDLASGQPSPGATSGRMPGCTVTWNSTPHDGAVTNSSLDDDTGFITACQIELNPGVVPMLERYAFLYLGATNPAMRYPFADSIAGRFMQIVVTHETGHSLGFDENFNAGTLYPTDSLHQASFLRRVGHTPSVMGYTFFDYVAQAADHLDFQDLLMDIGPINRWALEWAYRPVPDAKTPQDELPTLERWRAVQDTAFLMRVTTNTPNKGGLDAYLLGSDLVASGEAISQNLALTVPQIDAQAATAGADVSSLADQLRQTVMNVWPTIIASPGDVVGGVIPQRPYVRDSDKQPTVPMDSAQQVRALRFALAHTMYGQDPLVQTLFGRSPKDTSLMLFTATPKSGWTADQWQKLQRSVLKHLMNHWMPGVVEQAKTTHVLPVWCGDLRRLEGDLKAHVTATAPEEQNQAKALLKGLSPATDSTTGACHGV